jgi:hypothetical protein
MSKEALCLKVLFNVEAVVARGIVPTAPDPGKSQLMDGGPAAGVAGPVFAPAAGAVAGSSCHHHGVD